MENKFGYIGIIVAVVGIVIAIFQDDLRSLVPASVSSETSTMEKVFKKGAESFGIIEKEEAPSFDLVTYSHVGLGIVALIFGVFSYIKNENHRVSGVVGALSVVAIAWEYVLIGLIIAAVIYFLANLDF